MREAECTKTVRTSTVVERLPRDSKIASERHSPCDYESGKIIRTAKICCGTSSAMKNR